MSRRILLTDILFPNKYAKWRLVETKAFIDKYDTDILVLHRVMKYGGVVFNIDYKELLKSHSLDKYDILIFNPGYNDLDIYNDTDFEGHKYNGKLPFDFMFRLKKYRETPLNMSQYDLIYHIFLMCYNMLNALVKYPYEKQVIHMYPGGGLLNAQSLLGMAPETNFIVTQACITEYMKMWDMKNKYIEIFGGPFINKDDQIKPKKKNTRTLNVCFTSIGLKEEKGAPTYEKVVHKYLEIFPNDDIKFYSIGRDYSLQNVIYLGLMSQEDLDKYYEEHVDILFNLETGTALNGFPLGIEGLIRGLVLFTTDHYNLNSKQNFNYGMEMRIVNINDINNMVDELKKLYDDRDLLLSDSIKSQERTLKLFNFENTMEKTFQFIESCME